MLVSHQHKFLFIHVPKTAGASVRDALAPFADEPEKVAVNRALARFGIKTNRCGPLHWRRARSHATAAQLRRVFPRQVFDEYVKFAFVRNPWDLLVSYFHYICSRDHHHRSRKVQRLDGFENYVRYEIQRNKISQSQFVVGSDGQQLVDFVGRFESLADDFQTICRHLQIETSMHRTNTSRHKDYRSYYSDETAQMVADHWHDDIRRFGYSFDPVPASSAGRWLASA
jgi:hypothetical protein